MEGSRGQPCCTPPNPVARPGSWLRLHCLLYQHNQRAAPGSHPFSGCTQLPIFISSGAVVIRPRNRRPRRETWTSRAEAPANPSLKRYLCAFHTHFRLCLWWKPQPTGEGLERLSAALLTKTTTGYWGLKQLRSHMENGVPSHTCPLPQTGTLTPRSLPRNNQDARWEPSLGCHWLTVAGWPSEEIQGAKSKNALALLLTSLAQLGEQP